MYKYLESFNQFDVNVQVSEGLAPRSSWSGASHKGHKLSSPSPFSG